MASTDVVPEERLHRSYVIHALTAQLYRVLSPSFQKWAPDIAGTGLEPKAVAELSQLLAGNQIMGCEVVPNDDNGWIFAARLGSGEGPLSTLAPAGLMRGVCVLGSDTLPRILELHAELAQTPGVSPKELPPSGGRMRSLVHYFFSLVENPSRNPAPFYELLAESFSLDLVEPPLRTRDAIDVWVTGRLASVVASEHAIAEIALTREASSATSLRVAMKSQALFPDGSGAISRNTQIWRVRDDRESRFPSIEHIVIERDGVNFFGPAPDHAPRSAPPPS